MTIPLNNWCETCQEGCHDHPTICTVCGTTLGAPPATTNSRTSSGSTGVRAVPEFLTEEVRQASRELRTMLRGLRDQVQDIDTLARDAISDDAWQRIPQELLNPQAPGGSKGRPTSKAALANIPRIIVNESSSLFRQASLQIKGDTIPTPLHFKAVLGEFGPSAEMKVSDSSVIVASPRTGKGVLSDETKRAIKAGRNAVVYFERGDGVTFVRKAMLAQEAGASAVIIGNNMSDPWPYVMKDSKGEATTSGLKIPVSMIKQSDGKKLVECCRVNPNVSGDLTIQTLSRDCVVCCDSFAISQKVLQLPVCGHVFHESCALAWLTKQNTCPYCRRELPTDDPDYENERRRMQRTHAGSTSNGNESEWSGYYG